MIFSIGISHDKNHYEILKDWKYDQIESIRGCSVWRKKEDTTLKPPFEIYRSASGTHSISGKYLIQNKRSLTDNDISSVKIGKKRYRDIKIISLFDMYGVVQVGVEIPDRYFRKEKIKKLLEFLNQEEQNL